MHDDAAATAQRIAAFIENPVHHAFRGELRVCAPDKRSTSIIYKHGVKVESAGRYSWLCFAGECGAAGGVNIRIAETATSNATSHLASKHGIISTKTVFQNSNKNTLADRIGFASPSYKENPDRWYQV